jgi:hypothetical protein
MTPRGRRRLEKVDFKKTQPELYRASRDVSRVRAGRGAFLASDGVGEPGGPAFREAIGRIFALARIKTIVRMGMRRAPKR